MPNSRKFEVSPGQRFSRLIVLSEFKNAKSQRMLECQCACGNLTSIRLVNVVHGYTTSCGCAGKDARNLARWGTPSDGISKHYLYNTWRAMLARCYNEKHGYYRDYGGRGISVYGPWHDARTFFLDIQQLLGTRPKGFTLDRVDNEKGYFPGNIRWASSKQQNQNRRKPSESVSKAPTSSTPYPRVKLDL